MFDKAWFKEGPPKYYGRVTVYIDRRARKYRIRPESGMKYNCCITWGNTDEKQKSQWNKIMDRVEKYQTGVIQMC